MVLEHILLGWSWTEERGSREVRVVLIHSGISVGISHLLLEFHGVFA